MSKRFFCMICALMLIFFTFTPIAGAEAPPATQSEGAILLDSASGRVLYEKNADSRMFPASTTKIMTAVLALESGDLGRIFTASEKAVHSVPPGGSNMGILVGEQLSLTDLLYGALVYSANEACVVMAENIAGSEEAFVEMMNKKAKELGMNNTHYANSNGLHDDNHYTTARDMATLARYAMTIEQFREIVKTPSYTMPPTNKYTTDRIMTNTNYLISRSQLGTYYYKYAIGIKTGYTTPAGNCLVSAAKKDDVELIAVTLNAHPVADKIYSFVDSKNLFEYGFQNYGNKYIVHTGDLVSETPVKEAVGKDFVTLVAAADLTALLPNDADPAKADKTVTLKSNKIAAPVKKGDVLGSVSYVYDGYSVGSVDLVANEALKRNYMVFIFNRIGEFLMSPPVFVAVLLLILLLIVLYIVRMINRNRRRKFLRAQRYGSEKRPRGKW